MMVGLISLFENPFVMNTGKNINENPIKKK
jgi:hypothetical protein